MKKEKKYIVTKNDLKGKIERIELIEKDNKVKKK